MRYSREWHSLPDNTKQMLESFHSNLPVAIGQIAKNLGLIVKVSTLDVGISGMIKPFENADSGFKITINKHEPKYRKRFTLAHEISHYLLHRDQIGEGLKDDVLYRSKLSDAREAEANRLAADILMPHYLVKEWRNKNSELRNADAVVLLAEEFEVSEDAMRIRIGMKK